jgi:hypothetical protein
VSDCGFALMQARNGAIDDGGMKIRDFDGRFAPS